MTEFQVPFITCWHCVGTAGEKLQVYGESLWSARLVVGKHWQDAKNATFILLNPGAWGCAGPQARPQRFQMISKGRDSRSSIARVE